MNLTNRAPVAGLRPQAAYGWFREGKLPVPGVRVTPGQYWSEDVRTVTGRADGQAWPTLTRGSAVGELSPSALWSASGQ